MVTIVLFALLGLGGGALTAGLGMSLVVLHRGTGVVNFAQAGIAMWGVYVFVSARAGQGVALPLPRVGNLHPPGVSHTWVAAGVAVVECVLLGGLAYGGVFRWLRSAATLTKLVATVGVLLVVQGLAAVKFPTGVQTVAPLYSAPILRVGHGRVQVSTLIAAGIALAAGGLLSFGYRRTRVGLSSTAAAETSIGAQLIGLSPERYELMAWMVSGGLAAAFGILASPVTGLTAASYPLLVVPALAAALVARFYGPFTACVAGLVVGMAESVLLNAQSYSWVPSWATVGLPTTVPFVAILALLWFRESSLPQRGQVGQSRHSPIPAPPRMAAVVVVAAASAGLLLILHGDRRLALLVSVVVVPLMLSQTVVTGYLGLVSLAQITIAGVAAFSLSKLTSGLGLPPLLSILLALIIGTVVGVGVGAPALRLRGPELGIASLTLAFTAEQLVFANPALLNGSQLAPVSSLEVAGVKLGPFVGSYPGYRFSIVAVVVSAVCAAGVIGLRRSGLGHAMVALRSSPRALEASGIKVSRITMIGVAISSLLASVSGVMLGFLRGQVTADDFNVIIGLSIIAVVCLGGITSLLGAVVAGTLFSGGLAYTLLNGVVNFGNYYLLLSGLALVATCIANPDGSTMAAAGLLRRLRTSRPPILVAVGQ